MFDKIEDALRAFANGEIIIICDSTDRENEGDFIALAEAATPATINFMITHGRGLVCMPISSFYTKKLNLAMMTDNNTCTFQTAFTISLDHVSNSTGISAFDRCATIAAVVAPDSKPEDFRYPGHIFPLLAKDGGILERQGHTEAAVELAKLANKKPAGILCEILNDNGTMARRDDLLVIAKKYNLKIITIEDLVAYCRNEYARIA